MIVDYLHSVTGLLPKAVLTAPKSRKTLLAAHIHYLTIHFKFSLGLTGAGFYVAQDYGNLRHRSHLFVLAFPLLEADESIRQPGKKLARLMQAASGVPNNFVDE
jgi:hypothetical protein